MEGLLIGSDKCTRRDQYRHAIGCTVYKGEVIIFKIRLMSAAVKTVSRESVKRGRGVSSDAQLSGTVGSANSTAAAMMIPPLLSPPAGVIHDSAVCSRTQSSPFATPCQADARHRKQLMRQQVTGRGDFDNAAKLENQATHPIFLFTRLPDRGTMESMVELSCA
jgi:hypothetical protein